MTLIRVSKKHEASYKHPIILKNGERLKHWEERNNPWPEWLWCEAQSGLVGWVPKSYLRIEEDIATALCDYDATELNVSAGDELQVEKEVSGWLWCSTKGGKRGWIPRENTDMEG